MRSDDIDNNRVGPPGIELDWPSPSSPSGITIEDWDIVTSLALRALQRDCDDTIAALAEEMLAALATRMKSPLSHMFDQSSPPL